MKIPENIKKHAALSLHEETAKAVSRSTPGPWHLIQVCDSLYIHSNEGHTQNICDITNVGGYAHQANANLISAAPELLAQLDHARHIIRALSTADNGKTLAQGLIDGFLDESRAVLAKARGQ